ncbi:NAD-dependent malic enzyme [Grifola frondosa]|uniref:Malic enzyme n=1 Tax=Grifola frondosa TaxID=5627 RepID=A0A1C7LK85_GRIFR|nr:NAD-dependent malic enzyme [Grifola frondosa]
MLPLDSGTVWPCVQWQMADGAAVDTDTDTYLSHDAQLQKSRPGINGTRLSCTSSCLRPSVTVMGAGGINMQMVSAGMKLITVSPSTLAALSDQTCSPGRHVGLDEQGSPRRPPRDSILTHPRFNKGTAFTTAERKAFGLTGRLPYRFNTLEEQCQRAYDQLSTRDQPIRKNTFLQSLKDQNWVLYYGLISRHLKELIPIIYTPTQAEAIANYSHVFRRSEGMYLTFPEQDAMEEDYLEQTQGRDIQLIGVGGIGIAAAKSAIYTLLGGIDPSKALSVTLDVGTNNEGLLRDNLYVGWPNKRIRGKAYDRFVDKFVQLVRKYNPHSLLHFEDFGVSNAKRLLDLYRPTHSVFNDDVQGTGAVTLAAMMSAIGVTKSRLSDQRFLIYGAGTAGMGIANQLRDGMMSVDHLSKEDATKRFYLLDRFGLIKESLGPSKIRKEVQEYVRPDAEWEGVPTNERGEVGLLEVVKKVRPTVLIGCSTHAGAFTEEVIREMAKGTERPIIFPLSNPSKLVEVEPKNANEWTNGKALMASGSPFPPCKMPNGKEYTIAECNNALIYPGLGYGALITQAKSLTDSMIIAGTRRLASLSPALKNPDSSLLPDFSDAREVNLEVTVAVAEQAIVEGSATVDWDREEVRDRVLEHRWIPEYPDFVLLSELDFPRTISSMADIAIPLMPSDTASGAPTDIVAPVPVPAAASVAPPEDERATETLYIQNLNEKIKIPVLKASLRGLFKSYGEVLDVVAHDNLRMRGQAFVSFESADVAKRALKEVRGFPLYSKPMQISFARTRSDAVVKRLDAANYERHKAERLEHKKETRYSNPLKRKYRAKRLASEMDGSGAMPVSKRPNVQMPDEYLPPNKILFLQNLPDSVSKDQLMALFSQYPNLYEVRLIPTKKDIAFVEFMDEASATVAKDALHNYKLDGENKIKIALETIEISSLSPTLSGSSCISLSASDQGKLLDSAFTEHDNNNEKAIRLSILYATDS